MTFKDSVWLLQAGVYLIQATAKTGYIIFSTTNKLTGACAVTHTLAAVELEAGKASLNGSSAAKGSDVKPSDLNGSPAKEQMS